MLMEVARLGITGARRTKIQARKLLMSTMLVASVSVHAATLSGTVVGVSDGDTITVQWSKRDRYRRIVGKVLVTDPTCQRQCPKTLDAGLAQVTAGLAWWYRKYAKEQSAEDAQRYELAEQEARSHRAGLWSDGQPMPPWDWRKAAR